MWLTLVILGTVTAERLFELVLAARNTRALRARGAEEFGAGHYPFIVGLHAFWLGGLWILAWGRPVSGLFLGFFVLLQAVRAWVLRSLGSRWTTRIMVVPGEALRRSGPYRFLRHPNYVVVVLEIACLPLVFGLVLYAAVFSLLNAAALRVRIRVETSALARLAAPNE